MGSYKGPDDTRAGIRPQGIVRKKTRIEITITHEDGQTEEERDSVTELALDEVLWFVKEGFTSGQDFNLHWEIKEDPEA